MSLEVWMDEETFEEGNQRVLVNFHVLKTSYIDQVQIIQRGWLVYSDSV
jgi:hypothetical protein